MVTQIWGFLAAIVCGVFVHLAWGEGMYDRLSLAYAVAAEGQRAFHQQKTKKNLLVSCAVLCCAVLWCAVVCCGVVWFGSGPAPLPYN